jgi:hypothetical protein
LIFLILSIVLSYYYINRARTTEWRPKIRSLAGVLALEEAVGRGVEMGKPVVYSPGSYGTLQSGATGPALLAGISVLSYVTRMAARTGARLITTVHDSVLLPLAEDAVETAYRMENAIEQFNPESIRFMGGTQNSYISGHLGILAREEPASQINIGYFAIATVIIAEAGKIKGLMQIGGTTNVYQLPYLMAYDYALIGEEVFAAGADLSNDPIQLATIFTEDILKYIIMGLILLGLILSVIGMRDSIASLLLM